MPLPGACFFVVFFLPRLPESFSWSSFFPISIILDHRGAKPTRFGALGGGFLHCYPSVSFSMAKCAESLFWQDFEKLLQQLNRNRLSKRADLFISQKKDCLKTITNSRTPIKTCSNFEKNVCSISDTTNHLSPRGSRISSTLLPTSVACMIFLSNMESKYLPLPYSSPNYKYLMSTYVNR